MAFSGAAHAFGIIDGRRSIETPGAIVDVQSLTPLVFSINPVNQTVTKTLVATDHKIPGRHAPLQEGVAGGAEKMNFELIFTGTSQLAQATIIQATNWLFSLLYPTRSDARSVVSQIREGYTDGRVIDVSSVGRQVALFYGAWIPERKYMVRQVSMKTGPAQHPILLIPYRASMKLVLQEDQRDPVDFTNRRFSLGVGS